ncbi:glycogen debranching enzyme GlgX [Haliangium ochraceum DSM 14365]|uniref:Glycogen debranching enzyme GlgX n=2 Tax=Haliangium ochraceum TaxID=80816 RepID=D0LLA8_HALO1|nr:glycogen debranching enzyme GlgX [Haliangium ochraceum DSM 14365]
MWPGNPSPLGAAWDGLGVNFALYSERAEAVELLLFEGPDADAPSASCFLPEQTGPVWHGYIPQLRPGQLYGYRVHGPFAPHQGLRFNPNKVLLDPYARALGRNLRWDDSLFGYPIGGEDTAMSESDSAAYAPLAAVVETGFPWGDDRPPDVPWEDTLIYETHVKGISKRHPDVPEELRGTYLGLASEPIIEHLLSLGVTTVQLMPVQACVHDRHLIERDLANYWGYNTLAYFAPEPGYASRPGQPDSVVREFKMMVRALHAAGLEVIIDVVYNHTSEGNQMGPSLSFRGIDNTSYYKLSPEDHRYYMDYTGTGNTLDPSNPYVLQLITDSLRYWVQEMRVDGFRFDLASSLARELYDVNMLSAFFKVIQQDPVLSQVKLIAEPWDVGPGGYQVGNFPWYWAEWNGRYRDAVRAFWRGESGQVGEFATRASGSSDLYERSGRRPYASINFVTAHDGFSLEDMVSYEHKHNEANCEDNRDGHDHNLSQNCGVEGPSDDPEVLGRREVLKRSMLSTLLLSQGVPMILGGDELSRTQGGNNNAYCQDNEVSWYDWTLDERKQRFLEFVRQVVAFRQAHPILRRRHFLTGETVGDSPLKDMSWWHPEGREMTPEDWHNGDLRALGMLLTGDGLREVDWRCRPLTDDTYLAVFNSGQRSVRFSLPELPVRGRWLWEWASDPDSKKRRARTKHARPMDGKRRLRVSASAIELFRLVVEDDESGS